MGEYGSKLVDMHLHLQDSAFKDDLDAVLLRAGNNGILRFVCNATGPMDWEDVRELAVRNKSIIPCFGVHPWFVGGLEAGWDKRLEDYLRSVQSFVGEIGLDSYVKGADEKLQREVFIKQLKLAKRLGVGVMVHCVRAWGALMDVLSEQGGFGEKGGLIHAYSGSTELIWPLEKMGAYFSFGGSSINPKNRKLLNSLKAVPEDRILLETDSPDMIAVEGLRLYAMKMNNGKERNEPANLRIIVREVAKIRGVSESRLCETVWANAERFLGQLIE